MPRLGRISNRGPRLQWPHSLQLSPAWSPVKAIVFVRAVAFHFQTGQELDVAPETADCCFHRAGLRIFTRELRPFRSELPECGTFILSASVEDISCSALKMAFPNNVELGHCVGYGNGRKSCQDYDW
jgi:hypothetical protein